MKPAARELLTRDDLLDRIGAGNARGDIDEAVKAELTARAGSPADL